MEPETNPPPAPAENDRLDAEVVLSLLEADQVVAVKQRTAFGRRPLSVGLRAMLWGLRVYVALMLVVVAIAVYRAMHGAG